MTDLILYIVKQLVTNPDAVSVEEHSENGEVNLLLTVDPADMGLIIGKNGQTIKAIRKVLIVKAMADNVRVNLQLNEPAGGRPERSADQQVSGSAESVSQSTSEPENRNTDQAETADTPAPADTAETPVKAKRAKKTKAEPKDQQVSEPAESVSQSTSEPENTDTLTSADQTDTPTSADTAETSDTTDQADTPTPADTAETPDEKETTP